MIGLTLRQQIVNEAKRRGKGWETVADELADMAVEWAGHNRPLLGDDFKIIRGEVFRSEDYA